MSKTFLKRIADYFVEPPLVFISYSTKNSKEAHRIKELAEKYWANVFIAPSSVEAGNDFKESITSSIEVSDIFIPLISKRSIKSIYTQQEIGYAMANVKHIIPIRIEEVDNKDLGMIGNLHYISIESKELEKTIKKKVLKTYFDRFKSLVYLALFIGGIYYFQQ